MTRRQQVFNSPGLWSCPPTTTQVEVFMVGGGGGGSSITVPSPVISFDYYGGGGGGGIRTAIVSVTGPVPVTVGAGGSTPPGAPPTPRIGSAGGTSSFGPISVGGGGAGFTDAPSTGGGGGGNPRSGQSGGRYGKGSSGDSGGGGGSTFGYSLSANGIVDSSSSYGENGYGSGGMGGFSTNRRSFYYNQQYLNSPVSTTPPVTAQANSGAGAAVVYNTSPPSHIKIDATAGVVIVKWFE